MAGLARGSRAQEFTQRFRHVLNVAFASALIGILGVGLLMVVTALAYWMSDQDLVKDFLWMDR
jgi:hypothetical protein